MRITFNRACELIYNHYGKENVLQIRKPDGKPFYIVDLIEGTVILDREDLISMNLKQQNLKQQYENFKPTTIGEIWSRQKAIDEILNWIESNSDTTSRIGYVPTCEAIVQHLKEMKS